MTGFGPLLRKELLGLHRTGRLWVVLVIFLLVGLGSPLLASGLPALLSHLPEDQMRGVEILLVREPDLSDALGQYLKNLSLMPPLLVLVALGAFTVERQGPLPLVLSKPVSRRALLLSKASALGGLAVSGFACGAAGCALYSTVLFGPMDMGGFLALNGLLLLQALLLLGLTLLGGVLGRGQGVAAGLGLGGWLLLSALGAVPTLAAWTPAGLSVTAGDLVEGRAPEHPGLAVAGALVGLALALLLADRALDKQEV